MSSMRNIGLRAPKRAHEGEPERREENQGGRGRVTGAQGRAMFMMKGVVSSVRSHLRDQKDKGPS